MKTPQQQVVDPNVGAFGLGQSWDSQDFVGRLNQLIMNFNMLLTNAGSLGVNILGSPALKVGESPEVDTLGGASTMDSMHETQKPAQVRQQMLGDILKVLSGLRATGDGDKEVLSAIQGKGLTVNQLISILTGQK